MKKIILTLSLLGLVLTNQSCNKSESSTTKIDFTKTYEDAANALATAQKNYTEALASNDPVKIETTKKQLEEAQTKYIAAKNTYISEGGQTKTEYEDILSSSKESLENAQKTVSDLGKNPIGTTTVNQTAEEINSSLQKADSKISEVKDQLAAKNAKANETLENAKKGVKQTNENIKKAAEDTKKSATETLNKAKQDLNGILKVQ